MNVDLCLYTVYDHQSHSYIYFILNSQRLKGYSISRSFFRVLSVLLYLLLRLIQRFASHHTRDGIVHPGDFCLGHMQVFVVQVVSENIENIGQHLVFVVAAETAQIPVFLVE